ncbi:endonuclease 8-like 2 [Glandiceps talaboti]
MPEGPSVQRWSTIANQFIGRQILDVEGNTQVVNKKALIGCIFSSVQPYGKQMFLEFKPSPLVKTTPGEEDDKDSKKTASGTVWLRYHFLMWGGLRANELKGPSRLSKTQKVPTPRLLIRFSDSEFLAFYSGSVQYVDEPCDDTATDILKTNFDIDKATAAVQGKRAVCYTLLDQSVFAGLGNIMKNEALYTAKVHPLELGADLTSTQAKQVVQAAVDFSAMWMDYEKNREFKKTWQKLTDKCQVYQKSKCVEGHKTQRDWFGESLKRMTIWCPECQPLRGDGVKDGKATLPGGGGDKTKKQSKTGSKKKSDSESKGKDNKGRKRKNEESNNMKRKKRNIEVHDSSDSQVRYVDERKSSRKKSNSVNKTKICTGLSSVNKTLKKTQDSTSSKTQGSTSSKTQGSTSSKTKGSTSSKTKGSTSSKTKGSTSSKMKKESTGNKSRNRPSLTDKSKFTMPGQSRHFKHTH